MLTEETRQILDDSIHIRSIFPDELNIVIPDKDVSDTIYNIYHFFLQPHHLVRTMVAFALQVRNKESGYRKGQLLHFDDQIMSKLGEGTRDTITFGTVVLEGLLDDMREVHIAGLDSGNNILPLPIQRTMDDVSSLFRESLSTCNIALDNRRLTSYKLYESTLEYTKNYMETVYRYFQGCVRNLTKGTHLKNGKRYLIEDTSARPDTRKTPWPDLRQNHLRR